jgi:outer membrane protein TolC
MADNLRSSKSKWDEQIKNLKEQKEKKEQGLEYSVDSSIATDREKRTKQSAVRPAESKVEAKEKLNPKNPYVRKITLDELIDKSRQIKGEPQRAPERKTPFITREKEISAPQLSKH